MCKLYNECLKEKGNCDSYNQCLKENGKKVCDLIWFDLF